MTAPSSSPSPSPVASRSSAPSSSPGALTVVRRGIGTTVQDHGRPGLAHLGVPRAGAVDPPLADVVARLVGNPPGVALLETAGGLVVRAERALLVASSVEGAAVSLRAGDTFAVPTGASGRTFEYLAVRGGLAVSPVLGSASTDTLSGIAAIQITDGVRLAIGPDPASPVHVDVAPIPPAGDRIRLWPGPRLDRFGADALAALCAAPWQVGAEIDRIGLRLRGPAPPRRDHRELPSEGLVLGAVQLPPNGEPVVMLADHPTTGGYPVVAVVHSDDLPALVRRRPGTTVRFTPA